jgi:hypothetical protein
MAAGTRSLATALWGARFASGLLRPQLHHDTRDTTAGRRDRPALADSNLRLPQCRHPRVDRAAASGRRA